MSVRYVLCFRLRMSFTQCVYAQMICYMYMLRYVFRLCNYECYVLTLCMRVTYVCYVCALWYVRSYATCVDARYVMRVSFVCMLL